MPGAAELFYHRRSRYSRADPDPALGYSLDRNLHQNNDRRRHNRRHDSDGCVPLRRSPQVRPICPRAASHAERILARLDQGANQVVPSNSANADATISSVSRPSLRTNDRLPGAVLLARERLLERLGGTPMSGTRRSSITLSSNQPRDQILGDDFRLADAGDWGAELHIDPLVGGSPFSMSAFQPERLQSLQETSKKPPGLTQGALHSLQLEIFSCGERTLEPSNPCKDSRDCSICLEKFMDGDKLTRLPCEHRFHFACLDPWVRNCGDCPYCRRGILQVNTDSCTI